MAAYDDNLWISEHGLKPGKYHREALFHALKRVATYRGRSRRRAFAALYPRRKYGFTRRCGIGVRAFDRYVALTLQQGVPVTVVNQTGYELGFMAERRIAVKYLLEPTNPSPKPSPAMACGVAKRGESLSAGGAEGAEITTVLSRFS